jgi:hypothetical protein
LKLFQELGEGRIKDNDGRRCIQLRYIVRTSVHVLMYLQYNNNAKRESISYESHNYEVWPFGKAFVKAVEEDSIHLWITKYL